MVRAEQSAQRTFTNDEADLAPSVGGDISRYVEPLTSANSPGPRKRAKSNLRVSAEGGRLTRRVGRTTVPVKLAEVSSAGKPGKEKWNVPLFLLDADVGPFVCVRSAKAVTTDQPSASVPA